ncbi:CCAAT/enhancer-binding protein beta-like [Glandiceps talaboti]
MAPDSAKSSKKHHHEKHSDEYKKRRERNNIAVRKSRVKSKQKTQETLHRVNELKAENEQLEVKVKLLSKELSVLKDLFLAHAGHMPDTSGATTYCTAMCNAETCSTFNDKNTSLKDHEYAVHTKEDMAIKAEA